MFDLQATQGSGRRSVGDVESEIGELLFTGSAIDPQVTISELMLEHEVYQLLL
jgi:hypothetical protein